MPRRSLSFLARPGGLPVPVGCLVLSVWPQRAFLSCHVLSCSCLFSPRGLLIPPDYPREIGGGSKGSGCRGRTEAKAPKTICHGLLSSQLRHGLLSSLHRHGLLSSLHRHGFQSSQLRHGPCLSVLLWRSPSCVPVRVCPEGPPERPPPLPGGNVKARDEPFGRGELCQSSVVCVLCSRLMCPYLVCFLSSSNVIISLVCSAVCVNYPVYLVHACSVWFRLVYSLLPGVSVHVSLALSCPALMSPLKTVYLSLPPRLRVPVSSSCVHRDIYIYIYIYVYFIFIFN